MVPVVLRAGTWRALSAQWRRLLQVVRWERSRLSVALLAPLEQERAGRLVGRVAIHGPGVICSRASVDGFAGAGATLSHGVLREGQEGY